jgi:hypothetical protein
MLIKKFRSLPLSIVIDSIKVSWTEVSDSDKHKNINYCNISAKKFYSLLHFYEINLILLTMILEQNKLDCLLLKKLTQQRLYGASPDHKY